MILDGYGIWLGQSPFVHFSLSSSDQKSRAYNFGRRGPNKIWIMKRIQPQVLCSLASRSPAAVRVEPWGAKFEKNGRPPQGARGSGHRKERHGRLQSGRTVLSSAHRLEKPRGDEKIAMVTERVASTCGQPAAEPLRSTRAEEGVETTPASGSSFR